MREAWFVRFIGPNEDETKEIKSEPAKLQSEEREKPATSDRLVVFSEMADCAIRDVQVCAFYTAE